MTGLPSVPQRRAASAASATTRTSSMDRQCAGLGAYSDAGFASPALTAAPRLAWKHRLRHRVVHGDGQTESSKCSF